MNLSTDLPLTVEARALSSGGTSGSAIYRAVDDVLVGRHPGGWLLLDVGCGHGKLWDHVRHRFATYAGVDAVMYDDFPQNGRFIQANLDAPFAPARAEQAEVVAAVETIEHLENPREFLRQLVELCKPQGWMVLSTPNQLSLLSKLCLVLRNEFAMFRDGSYPAHLTALLEVDLRRMATECGLTDVSIKYTKDGRIPGVALHYPRWLSRLMPRLLSDNVLLVARKP